MTPSQLETLRSWVQNECRHAYYKFESDDVPLEMVDHDWIDICRQHADAAFFKVVREFCGTD